MATNPSKPPDEKSILTTDSLPSSSSSPVPAIAKTTPQCNCSNISIMQLFHEMKQEFPTVPDNVVSDLVYANCHNRLGCIESMRKAAIVYPCSTQAYPSQSIQAATAKASQQNPSTPVNPNSSKPPAPPKRGNALLAATRNFNASAGENNLKNTTPNNINNNNSKNSVFYDNNGSSSDNNHGSDKNKVQQSVGDNNNLGNTLAKNSFLRNLEAISSSPHLQTSLSQRPTTLSVKKDFCPVPSPNRPIRQAPPPPSVSPHQPFVQNDDQHQPLAEGLNVSLNVTVSPVAGRRPPNRPPRHTSALSVQPEPPFMTDNSDMSPRSYTSVNFTLRQPTNSPQSPIDISAGPSLTYSSSSFDARQGYQSRLQITVGGSGGGGGGGVSAMRARPRSCYNIQEEVDYEQQLHHSIAASNAAIKPGISLPNVSDTTRHLSRNADEKLRRQFEQKQRIDAELKNVRHHLETMHRDIRVLRKPIPSGGLNRLVDEISQLRQECVRMAAELDEAGVPVLGEINESVNPNVNLDGINVLGVTPSPRPPKPPRPPPPALTNNNNNNNNNTYDIEDNSINNNSNNNFSDGPSWVCTVCTFQNHPLLDKCEQCEMPNINLSTSVTTTTSGGTTGISENNYYNNTRSPQVNASNNSIKQITASDFAPPDRLHNQYQMSSSCDSLNSSNNNNINNTSVPAETSSYFPQLLQNVNKFINPFGHSNSDNPYTIGSQLTNAILLPATVVTPTLMCAGNNSPQPPAAPLIPTSGNYKTHRHTPSM